jgi:hypothetical protein
MAFRVHGDMQDANDPNASLDLRVENDVAAVHEAAVANANVVDISPHCGHFGELCEASLKAQEVFASLTFAKLLMRIDINFG